MRSFDERGVIALKRLDFHVVCMIQYAGDMEVGLFFMPENSLRETEGGQLDCANE